MPWRVPFKPAAARTSRNESTKQQCALQVSQTLHHHLTGQSKASHPSRPLLPEHERNRQQPAIAAEGEPVLRAAAPITLLAMTSTFRTGRRFKRWRICSGERRHRNADAYSAISYGLCVRRAADREEFGKQIADSRGWCQRGEPRGGRHGGDGLWLRLSRTTAASTQPADWILTSISPYTERKVAG